MGDVGNTGDAYYLYELTESGRVITRTTSLDEWAAALAANDSPEGYMSWPCRRCGGMCRAELVSLEPVTWASVIHTCTQDRGSFVPYLPLAADFAEAPL